MGINNVYSLLKFQSDLYYPRIFIVINMYHNKMFSPYIAHYIDNHFGNTSRLIQRS